MVLTPYYDIYKTVASNFGMSLLFPILLNSVGFEGIIDLRNCIAAGCLATSTTRFSRVT